MAMKVEKVTFWGGEIEDKPGALAQALEPLANAGVDLHLVAAYRNPAKPGLANAWVYPIKGRKATDAAKAAGFSQVSTPVVLRVEGTNKPGIGHQMTSALAEAGINLAFVSATVVGNKFVALFGFDDEADARKAQRLLTAAAKPAKKKVAPKQKKK